MTDDEADDDLPPPYRGKKPLHRWIRFGLLILVACWTMVFFVATQLDPYDADGKARVMETHRQLGLPSCTFKVVTGLPCPSCGMTTSFCLLIRGDVWNSLKANFAGTSLAVIGLLFIPWALVSAFLGRFVIVRDLELWIFRIAMGFLIVMFIRWGIALLIDGLG
jgi:hypothetical protein